MTIRRPLQKRLLNAWKRLVENDYCKQRINSERSLQAAPWASLNEELPDHQRMFIEPRFRATDSDMECVPDIVVCGRQRIIAVSELKYKPKGKGPLPDDVLNRLNEIAAMLSHRPYEEPMILPLGKNYVGPGIANMGAAVQVGKLKI
jgi:hypothetical protein